MIRRLAFALVALIALCAYAPIPFPKPSRDPHKQIQGKWVCTSYRIGSVTDLTRSGGQLCVHIVGEKLAFSRRQADGTAHAGAKYLIKLDPKKKPATIDFNDAPGESSTKMVGVFAFNKDELIIAFSLGSGIYPPAPDAPRSSDHVLKLIRDPKP